MATYWNQRCALCGQFVAASDREAMLEATRWEWSESVVDDARAANIHDCTDRDPYGARESERLIEAGLIGAELRWLIEVALERRQAAGPAGWTVFAGFATTTTASSSRSATMVTAMGSMACRRAAGDAVRAAEGRAHAPTPAGEEGRAPP